MSISSRRNFLCSSAAAPRALQAGQRRPNVVVLLSDDQTYSTVAALGNREIRTPNLDRMVRSGVAFTRAHIMGGIAPAVCVASRAMFLSGQTLFRADERLTAEVTGRGRRGPFHLLPEYFRSQGYKTFGTGKWHNRAPLYARSFSAGGNIFFGGMTDHFKVPLHDFRPDGRYPAAPDRIGSAHSSQLFTDAAVRFIETHTSSDPFLAYVAYAAPHDPRNAPSEAHRAYPPGRIRLPESFLPEHPFDNGELKIRDEMLAPFPRTPEIVRQQISDYYAMVTHMDAQIGRILDTLERTGRAADTIVVFASDNGLAVGRHGLMGKQNLYDHSVRVPLIFSGRGVPKNRRSDSLCYLLDVFPTLCSLCDLPAPPTLEGLSLAPAFTRPDAVLRDSLFLAYRELQRAVTTGDWKFIRYRTSTPGPVQLFHLRKDPYELKNLADTPDGRRRIPEMQKLLERWMKDTGDPVTVL
ncbi:MAG: sulfatase-like hydrolase/transferase [Bryobacterales bacterium]|nr:sulfatase-like hydrolase/transferase [Bryobacterales bacterium]